MTTHDAPLTDAELDAIEQRARLRIGLEHGKVVAASQDVLSLIAEVRRLQRIITDIETAIHVPYTDRNLTDAERAAQALERGKAHSERMYRDAMRRFEQSETLPY